MSDVTVILEETPVFVQYAPAPQLNVSVASPPQVYVEPTIEVPVNVHVAVPVPVKVTALPGAGPPGPPGPPGPQGQRGSLLLGMYGSQANLPNPGNDGLFIRDFAFDLDGNFYMIEET